MHAFIPVSFEQLSESNFATWYPKAIAYLRAHNCAEVVDHINDPNSRRRANVAQEAQAFLLLSSIIDASVAIHLNALHDTNTCPYTLMRQIKSRFDSKNAKTKVSALKSLGSFQFDPVKPLAPQVAQVKSLFLTAGVTDLETQVTYLTEMTANPAYEALNLNLLSNPPKALQTVVDLLQSVHNKLQQQKKKSTSNPNGSNDSSSSRHKSEDATSTKKPGRYCEYHRAFGHTTENCRARLASSESSASSKSSSSNSEADKPAASSIHISLLEK